MTKYIAALYARISISESNVDEYSTSILNQKSLIKEYARNNDIEIYDCYIDDGYSGGSFDRPAFNRMLKDIELGKINCVITKDISRLGRDFIGTGNYIYKIFPDKNIRYIAILDNLDTANSSINDDIIPFKTVINDMYLKDTSRKIKSSRHELMRKGLYMGSTVPYGYKRSKEDARILEIDEYAATIVKRIFDMRIEGVSPTMIARKLTNERILPPDIYNGRDIKVSLLSSIWKPSTVNYILKNEVYIGNLIQKKYERLSLKSKRKRLLPKDEWIAIKNSHEAIIDPTIFFEVNKNKVSNIRYRAYNYLLKGLVVCSDCNATMLVRRIKGKRGDTPIYCCKTYAKFRNNVCSMHYFREDILNNLIKSRVLSLFDNFSKEKLLNIASSVINSFEISTNYKKKVDELNKKIKENEMILLELYKDKCKSIISVAEYESMKIALDTELDQLRSELKKYLDMKKVDISNNYLLEKLLDVENYNKYLLSKLIDKITIDESKCVTIHYKFRSIT